MSGKLTVSGDEDGWQVFGKTPKGGHQRLFRSRAGWPPVRAYALEHPMMRLRCVLREDQVRDDGMPRSTKDLDDYEDRLLDALIEADAEVYFIASITGDGTRDLFFTMRDPDELRAGIKAAQTDIDTFKLQLAPLPDDKADFLDALSLSADQVQAAREAGRTRDVSTIGRGPGLLGKLFGR